METTPEPGAYEIKGDGETTGICAGCLRPVNADESSVVRYHPMKRGGVFHAKCEPQGAGWYSVDGDEYGC